MYELFKRATWAEYTQNPSAYQNCKVLYIIDKDVQRTQYNNTDIFYSSKLGKCNCTHSELVQLIQSSGESLSAGLYIFKDNTLYYYTGSDWINISNGSSIVPDIHYISFTPVQVQRQAAFKSITVNGTLKIEVDGALQIGDKIQLCNKRLSSGSTHAREYRMRPIFTHTVTARDINSRILSIPIKNLNLRDALRYPTVRYDANMENNKHYPRCYYPVYLRIHRVSGPNASDSYYSNYIQLHPQYTNYNPSTKLGGWLSFS